MRTAAGFRVHIGWADAVVVRAGDGDGAPEVVDRRRVQLRPRDQRLALAYHAAKEVPEDERDGVLAEGLAAAEEAATEAVADLAAEIDLDACGVVVGRGVHRIPLDRILASTSLFHTAEGEMYQRALRAAAANLGLPVVVVTFGDAEASAEWPVVADLGRTLGPPWRKDHKLATVAAWRAARPGTTARRDSAP